MLKRQTDLHNDFSENAGDVVQLMRVLSHPQRLCILCHLAERPRPVGELVNICGIAQAQVSQFLSRMRLEGLIEVKAVGRQRVYHLIDPRAHAAMKSLRKIYCGEDRDDRATPKKRRP